MALATIASPVLADGLVDATSTALPALEGRSMHALAVDIDADGDLDIVVAREFHPNAILVNDGAGQFSNQSADRLPQRVHDSEEVVAADFDQDGFVDLLFVSEDDAVHEFYINDGTGRFLDASSRIPLQSIANGVAILDVNEDGLTDVVLANNGQNAILINDGDGGFRDETIGRLPQLNDVSQDVEIGDVDGDGDQDLVFANEGANRVLLNDGGRFVDSGGLPSGRLAESRMASLEDIDGDGDLDLFIANVRLFMNAVDPRNQLFINDGQGQFVEETTARLPHDADSSFEGKLIDIDADGDFDILTGNTNALAGPGNAAMRVYVNDGTGQFAEEVSLLPATARGNVFGIEAGDFTGDGRLDLFLALRYGLDRLLIGD